MTTPGDKLIAVAAGGAAGAASRYAVSLLAKAYLPSTFPYGTLMVNISGSLLLGILIGLAAGAGKLPPIVFALVGTGFCGAFTTFSTFATDTLTSSGATIGIINILVNNAGALAAAAIGLAIGHVVTSS